MASKTKIRSFTMPTYMKLKWYDERLSFKTNPTGIRKFIRIPYLFSLPYFSGTMLEIEFIVKNNTEEVKSIQYECLLRRLSSTIHEGTETITPSGNNLIVNPNSKVKKKLRLGHLPQPGNYSLYLDMVIKEGKKWMGLEGEIASFDALPKDATAINFATVIASSIIAMVIGLIIGLFLAD
jgi:hypothetical protein